MQEILQGVSLVVLDLMGVVLQEGNLVMGGLYPIYGDSYSEEYLQGLYEDVRTNLEGDFSLQKALDETDPVIARTRFLSSFEVDLGFARFRGQVYSSEMRLGIISNMAKEWGEYFIHKFELEKGFDPIVISGLVGMKKPNKEIFELFISRSNCKPKEILFIDDKLRNLKGASEVGMRTVLFDRGLDQGGFVPELVISKFSQLY